MHKHKKLALLLAPILIILGFIAADYYKEHQAAEKKVFQLTLKDNCDVINNKCILSAGELKISISHRKGITEINSTYPLDQATLFLINNNISDMNDKGNQPATYPLAMQKSAYYWQSKTPLSALLQQNNGQYTLRLIAKIKGGWYIAEFVTHLSTS